MRGVMMVVATAIALRALSPRPTEIGTPTISVLADSAICPPDSSVTRGAVLKFLTSPGFADDRTQLGITVADTANLRVLVDSTDVAACQWFRQQITVPTDRPRTSAYYRVGGFFFIPSVPRCAPCLWHGGLAVFDTTFTLKKALGI